MGPPFTITAVVPAVRRREVSAVEVVEAALETIERADGEIQAFTSLAPERALADARALDARIARREDPGPLAAVPVGVKDVIDVAGLPTSYGTPAIPDRLPADDAECVARLRAAGALVVGKTRTSALAWRSDTPPTTNPRWPGLSPGGSSGGSAAAVAAGMVGLGLGTDTGGSIRWPAVQCGVAGLKPTTGSVSLAGVLPCSPSLDCVGALAPTARELATVHAVLAGSVDEQPSPAALAGARLGVLEEPWLRFLDDAQEERFDGALSELAAGGATLARVQLRGSDAATAILEAISLAEGTFLAERARGRFHLLPRDVRDQLLAALMLPAVVVERARRARAQLAREAARLFATERLDALVLPACTTPPIRRVEREPPALSERGDGEVAARAARTFHLASATGQPALVVPAGTGGPGGLQLVGRPRREAALLRLGAGVEARGTGSVV